MTAELTLLLWSCALLIIQIVVAVSGMVVQSGFAAASGNREDLSELVGWPGRAGRAVRNMIETFPVFVALVLIAHVAGISNESTVFGAQLYFFARIAFAIVYLIGVPYLRTLVWLVSIVGLILIFLQLL